MHVRCKAGRAQRSDDRVHWFGSCVATVMCALVLAAVGWGCAAVRTMRVPSGGAGVLVDGAVPSDRARAFAHFARGIAFLGDGRLSDAEQCFLKASELDPNSSAPLVKLGKVQMRLGKLEEARRSFSKAVEINEKSPAARRALASSYLRSGELEAAAAEMERVVALEPDNLSNYRALGAIYEKQNNKGAVLDLYRRLVDTKQEDPNARLLLARALERAGQLEEAEHEFESAIELAPMEMDFYSKMAAFEMRRGQPEAAIKVYRSAMERMPHEPEVYLLLGGLYEQLERIDDARITYRQAIEVDPTAVSGYLAVAQLEEKLNDITEAIDAYRAGLEVRPESIILRYGLASAYVHARNTTAAIAEFKKIVRRASDWVEPHYNLGVLYDVAGDYVRAQRHLRKAIALNPNLVGAQRYLAGTFAKRGQIDRAVGAYEKLVETERTSADLDALGILYLVQSNAQKGIEVLEKVEEGSMTSLRAVLLGGYYDMVQDDEKRERYWSKIPELDEAALEGLTDVLYACGPQQVGDHLVRLCERAIVGRSDVGTLYLIIGATREAMEDPDGAIKAYEKGLAAEPGNALMHFRLGALYEEKGDYDAATAHLRSCLAIDPTNAKACNYLGYMFAEQGTNLDEAEVLIKRALENEPENGYYLDSLGWVYYKEREWEKAIEFLELAVKHLDHDDAIVRDHLGDAHFAAGAVKDAVGQWRKALRLDPENESIKQKLQKHQAEVEPVETDQE